LREREREREEQEIGVWQMCTRGVRIGGDIRRGGQNAKTWRKIAQINSMPGGREDQAHTQPGQESPELSSLGRKPLTILSESP